MAERVVALEAVSLPLPSSPRDEVVLHGDMNSFLIYSTFQASVGQLGKSALIECVRPSFCTFGYPNDEGIAEHRLYDKGLSDLLGFGEVKDSELVREYETMSRRSAHRIWSGRGISLPENSKPAKRHFIISLKENVFEAVCNELRLVGIFPDHLTALEEARAEINLD